MTIILSYSRSNCTYMEYKGFEFFDYLLVFLFKLYLYGI